MKKVLIVVNVISFIDWFYKAYVDFLRTEFNCEVHIACNFDYMNDTDIERTLNYVEQLKSQGVILHNITFTRNPLGLSNIKAYNELKLIIELEKFDLVHCHTPVGGVLGRLAARNARKKGTRIMYTAHGFHFYKGAPIKNWLLYYTAEKFCAHFTDVLITINKEDYVLAQKKMKAQSVKYVPGVGIDIEKFSHPSVDKATKRRELGIPENAVLLISVGELITRKNHETVLRAIADMNVYYIIAGNGDLREHLENLIATLGLGDRVKLLGFRSDIQELLEASDIFVFPSLQEGLPVALMEAMASGLPCVVSNIRGNNDLLENTEGGFLCDPDNVSEFTDRLNHLISDPSLWEKMGKNNLNVIQKFSMGKVIREMRNIYAAELLDNK